MTQTSLRGLLAELESHQRDLEGERMAYEDLLSSMDRTVEDQSGVLRHLNAQVRWHELKGASLRAENKVLREALQRFQADTERLRGDNEKLRIEKDKADARAKEMFNINMKLRPLQESRSRVSTSSSTRPSKTNQGGQPAAPSPSSSSAARAAAPCGGYPPSSSAVLSSAAAARESMPPTRASKRQRSLSSDRGGSAAAEGVEMGTVTKSSIRISSCDRAREALALVEEGITNRAADTVRPQQTGDIFESQSLHYAPKNTHTPFLHAKGDRGSPVGPHAYEQPGSPMEVRDHGQQQHEQGSPHQAQLHTPQRRSRGGGMVAETQQRLDVVKAVLQGGMDAAETPAIPCTAASVRSPNLLLSAVTPYLSPVHRFRPLAPPPPQVLQHNDRPLSETLGASPPPPAPPRSPLGGVSAVDAAAPRGYQTPPPPAGGAQPGHVGGHKYVEVVRNRDQRRQLEGWDCPDCRGFLEAVGSAIDRDKVLKRCSRHRAQWKPYESPPDFWELSFLDEREKKLQAERKAAADEEVAGTGMHD